MKISSIKGMHDVGPPEITRWHWVEKIADEIFENAGFTELRTPVLEEEALFTQGLGTTTEIVEKEMYAFEDRSGKRLTLRPEGTASLVRAYIENFSAPGSPYQRFYYKGPMFRYERPQKGRYRQFYQVGAEVFGSAHPYTDAELISLAHEIFQKLGLTDLQLQLNSLGCKECRPSFREALLKFLRPLASTLCADCQRRLERNPLRILDCKNEKCIEITAQAPSGLDHLCEPCRSHFEGVQRALRTLSIPYSLNSRMVRGLDYYERTAFEFTSDKLGAQNAVAGGGRYDDLVKELGGPAVPAVGFAMGVERLVSLISEETLGVPIQKNIFVACLGEEAQTQMLPWVVNLRKTGWKVYIDFESKSLKSLLRQANHLNVDYTLIVGEEELKQKTVQIKDMKTQGGQNSIPLESLLLYFQTKK